MPDAAPILTFPSLSRVRGLVHAFSTRSGGVSQPPYDTLNLGLRVGDEPEAVLENRRRFAAAAGFRIEDVVATHQVHGTAVRVVGPAERGRGALEATDEAWACDALVTASPGVVLMGFAADCPVVMLADGEARVAAVAHAGWRSAFGGIVPKTVETMSRLGAKPERIVAAVGPAAQGCCYEVGGELIDALAKTREDAARFFQPITLFSTGREGEKHLLDLPALVRAQLIEAGLRGENVEASGACTICGVTRFFSHRAGGGKTGRMGAVVGFLM